MLCSVYMKLKLACSFSRIDRLSDVFVKEKNKKSVWPILVISEFSP